MSSAVSHIPVSSRDFCGVASLECKGLDGSEGENLPEQQSPLRDFFLSKTKARTSHDHFCVVFKCCQRICEAVLGEVAPDVALGGHDLGKIM